MSELQFDEWLKVFLEEKGLSEKTIEFEDNRYWHYMPVSVIFEWLLNTDNATKKAVKSKLVELDFHNRSIPNFLQYIAEYLITNGENQNR
jgi:hypothetical protein